MPFGFDCEYSNFDDCVRRNQDKDDPQAFCGALQRDTEERCNKLNGLSRTSPSRDLFRERARNFIKNFVQTGGKEEARDWFRIINKKDEEGNDVSEVFIFDEIGAWGTSADDFVKAVNEIESGQINVRINSPGGEVYDGIAIHNALKFHNAKVTATVEALAASAASFIAMSADEIVMLSNSEMMIHDAAGCCAGNAADMAETARDLDRVSNNIASIYAERTNTGADMWRDMMRAETWFSADEAVQVGLADRVKRKEKAEEDDESDEEIEISNKWNLSIFQFNSRAEAPNPLEQFASLRKSAKLNKAGTKPAPPDKPESEPTPEIEVDEDSDWDFDPDEFKTTLDSTISPFVFDPDDFKSIVDNVVHTVPAEPEPEDEESEDEPQPDFSDLKDIVRKVTR